MSGESPKISNVDRTQREQLAKDGERAPTKVFAHSSAFGKRIAW
jgi:hypothetical protein